MVDELFGRDLEKDQYGTVPMRRGERTHEEELMIVLPIFVFFGGEDTNPSFFLNFPMRLPDFLLDSL